MIYQRITSPNDPDIPYLSSVLKLPEIARYISIDELHYWDYVTTTENVFYFKVYDGEAPVAATHFEISNTTLYLSVMVIPKYQKQGIGSAILRDILNGKLSPTFDTIEVSIDQSNEASVRLFEKFGFTRVSQEDEMINYIYTKEDTMNQSYGLDITHRTDLVGICYTMWFNAVHGMGDGPIHYPWNVAELTEKYGWSDEFGFGNAEEQHNAEGRFHYWSEPAQGYYRSTDKAAHRKNLTMLWEAGVDFLVLDFTFVGGNTVRNKPFWDSHVEYATIALLDTIVEMRAEGLKTPYVVMWPNEVEAFDVFYEKFYGVEKWKDCFVYWNGKPFILHWRYRASETDIFTTRAMYGLQGEVQTGQWSYLEADNRLTVAYDTEGKPEHIGVSVATQSTYMSNTQTAHGRQGGRFWNTQWQTAFEFHPKMVTLTWWNEWCAQLFKIDGKYVFTDNFNQEFSRDIEPMKGGHGDLYYRWLCEYIRAYKAHVACPFLVQEN